MQQEDVLLQEAVMLQDLTDSLEVALEQRLLLLAVPDLTTLAAQLLAAAQFLQEHRAEAITLAVAIQALEAIVLLAAVVQEATILLAVVAQEAIAHLAVATQALEATARQAVAVAQVALAARLEVDLAGEVSKCPHLVFHD
ncbi:MAG: hypothetical protein F6K19_31595 [Cyanothece sp. SIO1E1]|nr:hypothetical protein [Cyanothece sp. SIO1E1]